MPRRVPARAQPQEESPPNEPVSQQATTFDPLKQLRTNWKWAAFSQFFFSFSHLFAMDDVSLKAIEEDLVHGSNIVLPRIMQRLLYTVSYDRKVSLDNWQTALRKQYRKRDPAANPIGPEPRVEEPEDPSSPAAEEHVSAPEEASDEHPVGEEAENKADPSVELEDDADSKMPGLTRASTVERGFSLEASVKGHSVQTSEPDSIQVKGSFLNDESAQEESKNWLDLPMLTKLDSMHLLTEWQFQNPMRLRTLMRSDDENASWRIEPIGYDSKKNAYWLIGADRLWLQRPIPRPPRTKAGTNTASLKRKRATPASTKTVAKGKGHAAVGSAAPAAKRPRLQAEEPVNPGTGRSRAAKAQAKVKLDEQAKELAELNRQADALARSSSGLRTSTRGMGASPSNKAPPPKPRGTRVSARLRGQDHDDEWQAVPEEWLNEMEGSISKANGKKGAAKEKESKKTGLESDGSEISDLTELSEESAEKAANGDGSEEEGKEEQDEDHEAEEQPVKEEEAQPAVDAPAAPMDDRGLELPPILPEGFVEWETICVTLHDWEHIAERFEKTTHYSEKALYKVLVNNIVPVVTEELREIERKEKLAMAMTQRKRSSRLLLRQSEKEQAEAAERKRREEEERNSRARRQEARAKKEEAEREKREIARELRRREREEREEREREKERMAAAAANGEAVTAESSDMQVDVVGDGPAVEPTTKRQHAKQTRKDLATSSSHNANGKTALKPGGSGSRTPVGDDWELDCEICHRRGINLDDVTPMMSCGLCSKWQHIACHDLADQQAGRRRRNWDLVEFFCSNCRAKKAASARPHYPQPQMPTSGVGHTQASNPYMAHSIASLGHASQYMNSTYGPSVPFVNGTRPYTHGSQVSNARSSVPGQLVPQQHHSPQSSQAHPQHQPYAGAISFSHYQPQHQGFSSTTEPLYGPSSHTQPYGHPVSHNNYPRYPGMNGVSQSYQQSPQAKWSNTTSQHSNTLPTPYNAAGALNASGSGALRNGLPGALPPQSSVHWQQSHHPLPAAVEQNAAPQHPTQFRYHPNSYQPAPT
ncbi:putative PHD zinc finger [Lyophyllum shimeji]|uniref:PHD zinc finger n=1 Tax=Lyophyllum shimeji TaxID=47721 RepID=A0A9P3PRF1_LYOSH|nr:putative PHD zinc finger [Lyophyllum shimeji]